MCYQIGIRYHDVEAEVIVPAHEVLRDEATQWRRLRNEVKQRR